MSVLGRRVQRCSKIFGPFFKGTLLAQRSGVVVQLEAPRRECVEQSIEQSERHLQTITHPFAVRQFSILHSNTQK